MKKIAIIGFGGAGYNAAKEVRRQDAEAEIHVYTDTDIGPYNPMLTTYYVKGAIPYDAMFPFGSLEQIERELRLTVHRETPVTKLEPEIRTIHLANGSTAQYDKILISTGASAVMPPIPGLDLPGVFKMRTAADAVALKKQLDEGNIKTGLVIGSSMEITSGFSWPIMAASSSAYPSRTRFHWEQEIQSRIHPAEIRKIRDSSLTQRPIFLFRMSTRIRASTS